MAKIKGTGNTFPPPIQTTRVVGILYFFVIHAVGLIGTPFYALKYGITGLEWGIFFALFFLSGMAITMGYHRLFAHCTYKANAFVRFLLLFFGASTFEQSALKWASQHRQHHQFTDTERDPYNINKGFWYAHIGWIMFWKHRVNYDNVNDLRNSRLVMHQHYHYTIWSVFSGIIFPMMLGFAIGHPLGGFVLFVCLRLVLVMNAAFFINSFAHTYGSRPFDDSLSARDHWIGAILTNGEGYHNFHHRFPADYRNGIRWYHWDPSKWGIYLLSKINFAWDLRRTPEEKIRQAETVAGRSEWQGAKAGLDLSK